MLSGYVGEAAIGEAILDAVARVRAANPRALYCCDPVIGDDRDGVYVRPGIAEMLRDRMLPAADIVTPNRFELDMLTGTDCRTLDQAKASVARLAARLHPGGPRCVLLTSLRTETTPDDATDMLVSEAGRFHLLRTPLLPLDVNGAGDAIAALFLFHRLHSASEVAALEAAGSAIHGLLRRPTRLVHAKSSPLRHRKNSSRRGCAFSPSPAEPLARRRRPRAFAAAHTDVCALATISTFCARHDRG